MLHFALRHLLVPDPRQARSLAATARNQRTDRQATLSMEHQGKNTATGHLYAVISDIHANLQALQAVHADAHRVAREDRLPTPVFLCLGDVVDYGPQPRECMDYLNERIKPLVWLRGNHDNEVAKEGWVRPDPGRVAPDWWPMTLWTRLQLSEAHRHDLRGYQESRDWTNSIGSFWLCHSTPRNDNVYVSDLGTAAAVLDILAKTGFRRGLFGHTHHQQLFFRDQGTMECLLAEPEDADYPADDIFHLDYRQVNRWHSLPDRPVLINPGSVGRPLSHAAQPFQDCRAAYLLLYHHREDGLCFQWRRVEYDVHKTQQLLRNLKWPDTSPASGGNPANGKDILKDNPADPRDESHRAFNVLSEEEREQLKRDFPGLVEELADELGRDTRKR